MHYPTDILYQVTRPARYTGAEWNSLVKDWEQTFIRVALAYPDLYEIGMSNMALPILYDQLNAQPDVLAERVYAPWVDIEAQLRKCAIPLLSIESGHQLKEYDIIGFSLGYELTYTNVLNMLDLAQIPVLSQARDDTYPLIMAGGTCVFNPEPMADFIDLFVIGEGEEILLELINCLRDGKQTKATKKERLLKLATIPGIYVPGLYQVKYQSDGLIESVTPAVKAVSPVVRRRVVEQLPPAVTRPVVPYIEVVHDRGAIEIQRGCCRGCRFCQAGNIYRPVRERPHQEVITAIGKLIANCGYDEVSLVSLNTGDYAGIDELINRLLQRYPDLSLSLPSLHIDQFSVKLVEALSTRHKAGLTFAPEAGSQRLRKVINKRISEDELMETAATAFARGWTSLKLYFMLGLPTETDDDIKDIIRLITVVNSLGKRVKGKRPQIRVSLSSFVPKPHTPFQWVAQESEAGLSAKHEMLRQGLFGKSIRLSWSEPKLSMLEAALSRGDRRLGKVIHRAWQLGSTFDAWDDCFKYDNWLNAFTESGLELSFYAHRERSQDEVLPWAHIDAGVCLAFLKQEYKRSLHGKETPDCRTEICSACGLERWQADCKQKYLSQSGR